MTMVNTNQDTPNDRRDVRKDDSSLSGSNERNKKAIEGAVQPKSDDIVETVDQDPGERQKENQNQQKEDPLAA